MKSLIWIFLLFSSSIFAFELSELGRLDIGKIVNLQGKMIIQSADGEKSNLKGGDFISNGSVVFLGPQAKVKILMGDHSIWSLGPDSVFYFEDFNFKEKRQRKIKGSLYRGSLRFLEIYPLDSPIKIGTPIGELEMQRGEYLVESWLEGVQTLTEVSVLKGRAENGDLIALEKQKIVLSQENGALENFSNDQVEKLKEFPDALGYEVFPVRRNYSFPVAVNFNKVENNSIELMEEEVDRLPAGEEVFDSSEIPTVSEIRVHDDVFDAIVQGAEEAAEEETLKIARKYAPVFAREAANYEALRVAAQEGMKAAEIVAKEEIELASEKSVNGPRISKDGVFEEQSIRFSATEVAKIRIRRYAKLKAQSVGFSKALKAAYDQAYLESYQKTLELCKERSFSKAYNEALKRARKTMKQGGLLETPSVKALASLVAKKASKKYAELAASMAAQAAARIYALKSAKIASRDLSSIIAKRLVNRMASKAGTLAVEKAAVKRARSLASESSDDLRDSNLRNKSLQYRRSLYENSPLRR